MKSRNHLYNLYKELILLPKIKQMEEDYSLLKSLETPFDKNNISKLFQLGNEYNNYFDFIVLTKGKKLFGDNFLTIYNEQKYLKEVLFDLNNLKQLLSNIETNNEVLEFYIETFLFELKQLRKK